MDMAVLLPPPMGTPTDPGARPKGFEDGSLGNIELHKGRGDGNFTRVATINRHFDHGFVQLNRAYQTPLNERMEWADVDGDGDLDVLVYAIIQLPHGPCPPLLYKNNGAFQFALDTASGLSAPPASDTSSIVVNKVKVEQRTSFLPADFCSSGCACRPESLRSSRFARLLT